MTFCDCFDKPCSTLGDFLYTYLVTRGLDYVAKDYIDEINIVMLKLLLLLSLVLH